MRVVPRLLVAGPVIPPAAEPAPAGDEARSGALDYAADLARGLRRHRVSFDVNAAEPESGDGAGQGQSAVWRHHRDHYRARVDDGGKRAAGLEADLAGASLGRG